MQRTVIYGLAALFLWMTALLPYPVKAVDRDQYPYRHVEALAPAFLEHIRGNLDAPRALEIDYLLVTLGAIAGRTCSDQEGSHPGQLIEIDRVYWFIESKTTDECVLSTASTRRSVWSVIALATSSLVTQVPEISVILSQVKKDYGSAQFGVHYPTMDPNVAISPAAQYMKMVEPLSEFFQTHNVPAELFPYLAAEAALDLIYLVEQRFGAREATEIAIRSAIYTSRMHPYTIVRLTKAQ